MWEFDANNVNNNTSCYDGMVEMMLKALGLEYQLFGLKKFSPHHMFVNENGDRMIVRGTDNNNVLYDIFGVKSTVVSFNDIKDLHQLIKDKINNAPVGAFVNAINCEWTLFYKKQCINHFILIIDIDEKNKTYRCIDNYYAEKGTIELTFGKSERIFERLVLFEIENKTINFEKIPLFIKNYINVPDKVLFDKERNNMDIYISNLSVDNIGTANKIYVSSLLLKLKWIASDKTDFAHALQYYDSKLSKPIFMELYNTLEYIADEVNFLKNTLVKYVLTNKLNREKISSYINNIYDANYQFCLEINNIINKEL